VTVGNGVPGVKGVVKGIFGPVGVGMGGVGAGGVGAGGVGEGGVGVGGVGSAVAVPTASISEPHVLMDDEFSESPEYDACQ
jgi:hypothetical protein